MSTATKASTDPRVQGNPSSTNAAPGPEGLISLQEVARRLQIPESTLYAWRYKGTGPRGYRLGRHVRYRWGDVLEWLETLVD
jgi:excisionase family DNA binding protein